MKNEHTSPFLVTSSFLGELPGQVLSFAANTIYMAITCSNHRPAAENDEESDAKTPSKGKTPHTHTNNHPTLTLTDVLWCSSTMLYGGCFGCG